MKRPFKLLSATALSALIAVPALATPAFAQETNTESKASEEAINNAEIPEEERENAEQIPEGSNEIEIIAPNKAPEHLEIVTDIEEPTEEEQGSVTVSYNATVDEMLGALAPADDSQQTHEVTGEDGEVKEDESELETGDELIVTAEDRTEVAYAIIAETEEETYERINQ